MNLNVFFCFRKRSKISPPPYEATMEEFKVKQEESSETDDDEQDARNNNEESCQEKDLEAIWKVMSTYHE